jgi:hypothetical protein
MAGDGIGPHIISDMTLHILVRQAKVAAVDEGRYAVGGMVAGDQPAGRAVGPVSKEGSICHAPVIDC